MTRLEQYLAQLQRFGIRPGLERIAALLSSAGEPQQQYPVVLVGGTNGKGSTCEFLARMLAADGRHVGLYTSPHLYRWNERIRVLGNGKRETGNGDASSLPLFADAIADKELDALFDDALPHLEAVASQHGQPTEFETLTFLGLWYFARALNGKPVDAAVVEVGLGGRWDATNATNPTVSVITHVALDHCDRLGNTLQAIAADKTEIARPGRVLVTAETKPQVLQIFRAHCDSIGARLWSFRAPDWSNDAAALRRFLNAQAELNSGDFQELNAATARVAKAALEDAMRWPPSPITHHSLPIAQAVPGRVEVLRENPLVLIDGANNPDGAAHLQTHLQSVLKTRSGHLILVPGILADKDFAAMIGILAPLAHTVIATQSDSPRAAGAEIVAAEARRHCSIVEIVTPMQAAVERALQLAAPDDVICVTGSFYTIAEVDRAAFH